MITNIVMLLIGFLSLLSVAATILAVRTRDLLYAVVFSALQSTCYAFIYFLLMAPDIALVYVAVSVGVYPLVLITLVKRTGRYEGPYKSGGNA